MNEMSYQIEYYENAADLEGALQSRVAHTKVALDIGCGIRPMTHFVPQVHLCLEPFEPYIKILLKRFASSPGLIPLRTTALEGLELLPDQSVDSIFLLDVIEHMTKEYGLRVMTQCRRVARKQIVVSTPLGFMPQAHEIGALDGWGVAYNKLQDHLSGWLPEDFGMGWNFLVCPTYHVLDAHGTPLAKPFGSFYAVNNISGLAKELPVSPILIGRSIPPSPVDGKIRTAILELFDGYDQRGLEILSGYNATPYSPNFNIPNLSEFSVKRLDGNYNHIEFPLEWGAKPCLSAAGLEEDHQAFFKRILELCKKSKHNALLIFDFSKEELLLAYLLARETNLPVLLVCDDIDPDGVVPSWFDISCQILSLGRDIGQLRNHIFSFPNLDLVQSVPKLDSIEELGNDQHDKEIFDSSESRVVGVFHRLLIKLTRLLRFK